MLIENVSKGLPVRLVLGAVVDTQLGPKSRPVRYVADANGKDGRRAVPANVDADGNERAPEIATVIGVQRRGRGNNAVAIEFPDLSRGEIDPALLEQAGELPPVEAPAAELSDFSARVQQAVEATVGAALSPLAARVANLEHALDGLDASVVELGKSEAARAELDKTARLPENKKASAEELQRTAGELRRDLEAVRAAAAEALAKHADALDAHGLTIAPAPK